MVSSVGRAAGLGAGFFGVRMKSSERFTLLKRGRRRREIPSLGWERGRGEGGTLQCKALSVVLAAEQSEFDLEPSHLHP
jgi:hypothetical protein